MDFINEEDNLSVGVGHFIDNALETFLKFALIFCTGQQCAHVETEKLLVLQILRYIATNNTLCQAFNYGCFTRTWFTDEDRIILASATQDLQNAANLLVATNNGIEFTCAGFVHEVAGVFAQCLVSVLARSRVGFASTAQFFGGSNQAILCDACIV